MDEMESQTIVEYRGHCCGYCLYCGDKTSSYSHGMWIKSMTVEDFMDLMDRGWKRYGKYFFKPTMQTTCCPQYIMRLEALDFKLSQSKKRVLKRVHKYLKDGIKPSHNRSDQSDGSNPAADMPDVIERSTNQEDFSEVKVKPTDVIKGSTNQQYLSEVKVKPRNTVTCDVTDDCCQASSSVVLPKQGCGADPNKPLCKKAKERRLYPQFKKVAEKEMSINQTDEKKQLEQYLEEIKTSSAHKLEIKLVRCCPPCIEFTNTVRESFAVYKKYQVQIHNDLPDEEEFRRYLVESPLREEYGTSGPECGYGSFHQQYWLDGQLICVGVIDILPRCVSSVYFYYDPDFRFLTPGAYSALREIEFTRNIHKEAHAIQFYYMGTYVHSCPKILYKGLYHPTSILCPEVYTWMPIEKCRPKLDANKYSRLEKEGIEDENGQIVLDKVLIKHAHSTMPYAVYKSNKRVCRRESDQEVLEYAMLVGKKCAYRMTLFRP